MPWTWRYEPETSPAGAASQEFPTQSDAETWIGETWRELLESGVEQVTLAEDDHVVYGPMGLRPE
jgi:hypothetical protein